MLFRWLCILLLMVFLSSCRSALPSMEPILRGQIVWQGEVRLRGDVILEEGAELVIMPGTRVVFEPPGEGEDLYQEHPYFPGSELIVRGRLLAIGSSAEPIRFIASNPDAAPGSWGAINIEDSPEVQFKYCRFEQADSAVHARRSRVSIEKSVFRQNLVAVRFHDTRLLVEQNLFEHNGTAIRFHFGAPVIRNNLIRFNQKGLFISAEPADYRIENNSFIDNRPYQVSLGEGVRKSVDLKNNHWSETAGSPLEALFFDGRIDDWLGVVDYLPVRRRPVLLESIK